MPGKQMAIDADLNAGLIDQAEAKHRRAQVVREADFYGAMDGASKFVRGDAIAGILILFINIIGGIAIGLLQHSMDFGEAAHNYTLLTIGDGLVAQIPALVLSTAAALMVTRVSSDEDMGKQILTQLFDNPRTLGVTAGVIGILGLIPGMPNLVFLTLAGLSGYGPYQIALRKKAAVQKVTKTKEPKNKEKEKPAEPRDLSWEDVVPIDTIGLEVGYKLIPLVDKKQGGQLMGRIKGIRRKLTQELGFLIPPVHIRDNLELSPNSYRIILMGVAVGEAEIYPERDMAINPGQVFGTLSGIATKDPAFNMDAIWIDAHQRDQAQTLGYTVVDSCTVIATNLSQLLKSHAYELLGREEVQQLLNTLASSAPKLVEGLVPDLLPLGVVQRVLRNLLIENIPIRDMRTIVETLAAEAPRSQDPDVLTAAMRVALGRLIVQNINGMRGELPIITLDPALEQLLHDSLQMDGQEVAGLEPGLADSIHRSLMESAQRQEMAGEPPGLLVPAKVRAFLQRFVKHTIPNMHVLSYNEVPENKQLRIVANVGRPK